MRFGDLLRASLGSLWQRKFRTALTVLGVVIGTTSVVVMVSLGTGLSASNMEQIERNANLRQVQVWGPAPEAPGVPAKKMNDAFLAELKSKPGVARAWGVYQINAELKVSGHTTQMQVEAVPYDALVKMPLQFETGGFPQRGGPLALVMGDKVADTFYDPMTGMPLEVDFATSQIQVTFGVEFGECVGPGCPPKDDDAVKFDKMRVEAAGVLAGDPEVWTNASQIIYTDLDVLRRVLEKEAKGLALPNQPATATGRATGEFLYNTIVLSTDTMEEAEQLNTLLREEGVSASSDVEWIREMQQQSSMIQAVFGGIGAISLLVAAIGIANTMMMSVYERTKEIGVMKVLGAKLSDIRSMFLVEAASIGFFGGLIGLSFSLVVSSVLNATLGQSVNSAFGGGEAAPISLIPVWLMVGSLVFATLIGTVAGLVPAQRAMKLSPLAAIRSQ